MARVWEGLATCFAEEGHDVRVIAREFPGQAKHEFINGVEYIRFGGFDQGTNVYADLCKDFIYAARTVRKIPPADILVTNDFFLPMMAGWLNRKAGKLVLSANRYPKRQFPLYRKVGIIAAASTTVADAIAKQSSNLSMKTKVIPNPVDTNLLAEGPLDRLSSETFSVLFVGRVHPEKGLEILVKSLEYIDLKCVIRLDIVGPTERSQGGGGNQYLNHLKALSLNTKHTVVFHGPEFSLKKLCTWYQNSTLFCYPTIAENGEAFPVAPIEAMATGLVPIVSNLKCFDDLIIDKYNGFTFDIRASNPSFDLGRIIANSLGNIQQLRSMSAFARSTAEKFSFPLVAKAFLKEFEGLVS